MNKSLEETKNNLKVKTSIASPKEAFIDNIDPEILDFVVVLNHLGFNTYSSCQGHVTEKNSGYTPYVLLCSKQAEEIYKLNLKGKEDFLISEYYKMLDVQSKLIGYLDEFYLNRSVTMRNRLIVETSFFYRVSILPYFSVFAKAVDSEDEKIKLNKIFLEEIHQFTNFLKTKI